MKVLSYRKHAHSFDSIVGMASRIEGKLLVDESIRIDGMMVGNVQQQTGKDRWLIVGAKAEIHGDILAQNVSVAGKVIGNIVAAESVELLDGCEVRGNITHQSITVEPGASLHGQLIAHGAEEDSQATAQRVIAALRNDDS